ncbi:MAG: hypothetical protein AAGF07_00615 [Patescibacteria group bacterium]
MSYNNKLSTAKSVTTTWTEDLISPETFPSIDGIFSLIKSGASIGSPHGELYFYSLGIEDGTRQKYIVHGRIKETFTYFKIFIDYLHITGKFTTYPIITTK